MSTDGNLVKIFQTNLPEGHWQPVQTWSTGQGVPDAEVCFPPGRQCWIEMKKTSGWVVTFETGQVAWLERRVRAGGRAFVAVRRQTIAGPRRGAACDELWLFKGEQARHVSIDGLKGPRPIYFGEGGPARWHWIKVKQLLTLTP